MNYGFPHTLFTLSIPVPPLDGDVLVIKEHLIDELDYILVPTEGWNKLVSWYGLTDGQEPISRKVCGQNGCSLIILIFLFSVYIL